MPSPERDTLRAIQIAGVKLYKCGSGRSRGAIGVFASDGRFLGEAHTDWQAQRMLDADRLVKMGGVR